MAHGGARPGAGAPKKDKPPVLADKGAAARLIEVIGKPKPHEPKCPCEICRWWELANAQDLRVRLDTMKYLYDKRDGKAVQTVNHVHDKPIDMNVSLSMADVVRQVRQRKAAYERTRK